MTTPLSEIDLPDAVVEKACEAFDKTLLHSVAFEPQMKAAIRATLQALLDMGRARMAALSIGSTDGPEDDSWEARSGWRPDKIFPPALIIRLDADERKRELRQGGPEPHEREQWDPQKGRYG